MARAEELQEGEVGRINIAKDVIATIAALAACEIPGVFAPTGEAFSRGPAARRYVDTELLGGRVRLALKIAVEYGRVVPEVVQDLQEKIKTEVERMTALPVETVDVEVTRVVFAKERA
ncbi:MAG: Asp23/Gls24 family envelope stress response protein [Candidatus Bipolaricaulota bacterium]|nr:Asp23/Gls24 family envelope stress response protein [Candidatus Bipolaricaulota bacterium]MDW8126959.1 Asp23/Gls24 family envelope stress response protein [Candidatus Bipolaricaulota bacterium]